MTNDQKKAVVIVRMTAATAVRFFQNPTSRPSRRYFLVAALSLSSSRSPLMMSPMA